MSLLNWDEDSFFQGFWDMLPLSIGAAPFALMVGTLAAQSGVNHIEMLMMSALVFAGAAQFTALEMWGTPIPVLSIIMATAIVNVRHVMMGAALVPHIGDLPRWCRWSMMVLFTDESWAMTLRRSANRPLTAVYTIGLIIPFYLSWQFFSVLGVSFGNFVSDPAKYGFDFVFTAVFITMIMGFWKGSRSAPPLIISALVALAAYTWIPGVWYIFLGGLAGVTTGALMYRESSQ